MYNISTEGNIILSRGDSFEAALFINKGTNLAPERYTITENDTVYFAILEPNQKFENAIIKKVFNINSDFNSNGDLIISLRPQDTENLLIGNYFYTIKLKTDKADGSYSVATIIPERQFTLTN